jgi:hypothetical protein
MPKSKLTPGDVLCYGMRKRSGMTVRRFYMQWRAQRNWPKRCDNPKCEFHTAPLEWVGAPLPLILDHVSGDHCDNSPDNLQLLCPNCDAQLPTRGGRNRGRIQAKSASGYAIQHSTGRRDARVFPTGVAAVATEGKLVPSTQKGEKDT